MMKADQIVPMKYSNTTDSIKEYLKLYFKEMWVQNIDETLKHGYEEMSEINLTLSEIGIQEDMSDLVMYESMLIGREKL